VGAVISSIDRDEQTPPLVSSLTFQQDTGYPRSKIPEKFPEFSDLGLPTEHLSLRIKDQATWWTKRSVSCLLVCILFLLLSVALLIRSISQDLISKATSF
jgi:hypothetical protein